ncbi:hypothetical protein J4476_04635 [Candidatus Woesearchaeota archaeon]|nr:MAG: hypothetical protein QT09_C0015G0015 [archaeon GW2011_AR18]MBS3161951.1 hypothetical protein [Candidatus Woesearchaeota archaeon]HIH25809.1 hypothetical protein [Nanoarchaeota archaeon]
MVLQIDFNNRHIIQGYLEQTIKQVDIGTIDDFSIKYDGNYLIYHIFGGVNKVDKRIRFEFDYSHNHNGDQISLNSLGCLARVQEYFEEIKCHVVYCQQISSRHDFGLFNNYFVSIEDVGATENFLDFGIGGYLGSFERFEKFIEMVVKERQNIIDSRSRIDVAYGNIKK